MRNFTTRLKITLLLCLLGSSEVHSQWVHPPSKELVAQTPGLEHHTFESEAMAATVGFNVILPESYPDSEKQHPVVYWLHGGGGNESSDLFIAKSWRDHFEETDTVAAPILVFANGFRSGYMDHHDGKIMIESMIIKELIPLIDKSFRTIADQNGRAVHGFSMGSSGAFKFSTKYPDLFCAAVGYGGGAINLEKTERPFVIDILERNLNSEPTLIRANNSYHFVKENSDSIRAANIRFLMITGEADDWKQTAVDFDEHLRQHKIDTKLILVPDVGHDIGKLHQLHGTEAIKFQQKAFVDSIDRRTSSLNE